jgi:hypothetical protein
MDVSSLELGCHVERGAVLTFIVWKTNAMYTENGREGVSADPLLGSLT